MYCQGILVIRHGDTFQFSERRAELKNGFLSLFEVPNRHHDVFSGAIAAFRCGRGRLLTEGHSMILRHNKFIDSGLELIMEQSLLLKFRVVAKE